MYHDKYFRSWEGPFRFDQITINSEAPRTCGIYQVLKEIGGTYEVMYIGIADQCTIRQRLYAHFTGFGNRYLGALGYTGDFCFVFWLCDGNSAKQIESHVINNEKPPFNVKNEYKYYVENVTIH